MNINPLFFIAKKEILDNVRNKWIVVLSVIFTILTLVASYFGSIDSQGWQDFGVTISSMMGLVQFLIPIIALMLGYASIIGEIERGSMNSLISLPVTRLEILLGKFFGLGSIISFTIFIGFGVAGLVIAVNVSGVNVGDYFVFIGATILFGLLFLALALFLSSLFKKRSTAMGMAILFWFLFNMILPLVFLGVMVSTIGFDLSDPASLAIPDWYFILELVNPISIYTALISLNVGPVGSMQGSLGFAYPEFYSSGLMIFLFFIWVVVSLGLSFWLFSKSDI